MTHYLSFSQLASSLVRTATGGVVAGCQVLSSIVLKYRQKRESILPLQLMGALLTALEPGLS